MQRIEAPVLITGATGFIGSHLTARLAEQGVYVRCLRHPEDKTPMSLHVETAIGSLQDFDAVREAVRGTRTVFHLGGVASVPGAQANPREAFQVNVEGTCHVLESARVEGKVRVIVLSTAHVYGMPGRLPVNEAHPEAPQSVYASTKLAADAMGLAYHRNLGVPVQVLRTFNVYGPGQRTGAVIPTAIEQALRGNVQLRDLRPRRDFVFVADVVAALIAASRAELTGEPLLLSSGRAVSVRALVQAVGDIIAGQTPVIPPEPAEGDCLVGDSSRARAVLSWEPRVSLETGLAVTVAWWREHGIPA